MSKFDKVNFVCNKFRKSRTLILTNFLDSVFDNSILSIKDFEVVNNEFPSLSTILTGSIQLLTSGKSSSF